MQNKRIFVLFVLFLSCSRLFADEYTRTMYKQDVEASYYAEKFHGRKTANGETFNMNALTAAHKTLAFGTLVEVTNLANGKKVIVRINDRGPFVKGREIDLSKAAATKLDMIKTGTARVQLIVLKDKKLSNTSTYTNNSNQKWRIQIASYTSEANAYRIVEQLRAIGLDPKYEKPKNTNIIRVVLPYIENDKVENVEKLLKSHGYNDYLLKKEP